MIPGPGIYNLSSYDEDDDIFILKLSTSGDFIWAKKLSGSGTDWGRGIAIDESGNVYTTGEFSEVPLILTRELARIFLVQIFLVMFFIVKLNTNGEFVWAKSTQGSESKTGFSIAFDNSNNVYISGHFAGTADFDPGSEEFNLTATGTLNLFILKLNSDGEFIWAKNAGSLSLLTYGYDMAIDRNENIYTTGSFQGTADFDPGIGTYYLTADGDRDIFVLKLDSDGNFLQASCFGGGMYDTGRAISVDKYNNALVTGYFSDTVDFDPGIGIYNLSTNSGINNVFILKLSASGDFIWAGALIGIDNGSGFGIATNDFDDIYTAGTFRDTTDFDPSIESNELVSYGYNDPFVQKMSQPCPINPLISSTINNFAICPGDSIILTAQMPSVFNDVSYFWNTGDTFHFNYSYTGFFFNLHGIGKLYQ